MLERRVEGGGPHTEWGSPPKGGFAPQKKNPKKIKFFPKNFFGESGSLKKCCRGGRTEGGAPQKFVSKKPSTKNLKHVLQLCNPAIWSPRNIHFITLLSRPKHFRSKNSNNYHHINHLKLLLSIDVRAIWPSLSLLSKV